MYNTDLPTRAELPTTGRLLRSTVVAALIAAVLLVTTILPAEYGIDPTGVGRALGLTHMGEIKVSLAAEAVASASEPAPAIQTPPVTVEQTTEPAASVPSGQEHTMTVTLKPGQAAEIKLAMRKDARVLFEWISAGGPVNFDTHGDPVGAPKDFYHGYDKGKNQRGQSGELQAAFDGTHGWFWRNRSNAEVTITLKTSGEYEDIKRVL
ncbi:transmembrane anchor protein [Geoalkalibacter halelectricus]|uniref:Transmembrane anchor protein n=1 Tax=Geoalkalibacter halelectricus TaxID=2847045 RepID=A0ABY5ZK42_9BACT|nr:transmembrane anchor protein [Geoalkalibacter halelectricus]MDO3380264.1 transmembrane anchor protein [Geoalkalibacter halelectricus]UWZ79532.1 transmembrane anchor protein [Geoalkalibacter halelectricus]